MRRLTRPTAQMLAALLQAPHTWRYGYDLTKESGIASGTLYPLLARLVDDGWLETRWENSAVPGRPPRHLYRLTPIGRAQARAALAASSAPWAPELRPRRT
jgi:PadR family transcriptional regulator PadR